jgi:hypothetical protein
LKDVGVDGRIILKQIFKKRMESMKWIALAQNRHRRLSLVKTVITLRVA